MFRFADRSPILLYHATFARVPDDLAGGLHNVSPTQLERQLVWLKRRYRFVTIDEWFEARNRCGLAAITFDDAYLSVFDSALPVLRSLDVPAAIFVNGATVEGKLFWRDKIRCLVARGLTRDFMEWLPAAHPLSQLSREDGAFYTQSKCPSLNSAEVDRQLDAYFASRGIALPAPNCVYDPAQLVADPLVTYGNHTYHHYVLSGLTRDEQVAEISRNHDLLASLGVRQCNVLSIPFGALKHFNQDTLQIARELGYRGYLLSRGRLNAVTRPGTGLSLEAAERYMPASDLRGLRLQVFKLLVTSYVAGKA